MPAFMRRMLRGPTLPGWVSILVRVAGVATVIPIALRVLSPADAVLWMFFTTVLALSPALDFGHSATFMRLIAYARAQQSTPGAAARTTPGAGATENMRPSLGVLLGVMPGTYLRLTLVSCAVSLPVVSAIATAPIAASSRPGTYALIWVAVCLALCVQTYCSRYIAILQGFERVATHRWIEAGQACVANVAAALALWHQESLAIAILSICASAVAAALMYRGFAIRAIRTCNPKRDAHPDLFRSAREEIWGSAWRSGIGIVFGLALPQMLTLAASNFLAPVAAASFMFAMRVAQVISALSQSPFYGYLPSLARQYHQGLLKEVRLAARRRMAAAAIVLALGFVCAGMLVPLAMQHLKMTVPFVTPGIWLVLGYAYLAERIGGMHMQLYTLGGRVIWHWVNGATGLVMLTTAAALVSSNGPGAIPIAMLVAYTFVYCAAVLPRSYGLLHLRFASFELYTAVPAAVLLSLYCIVVVY